MKFLVLFFLLFSSFQALASFSEVEVCYSPTTFREEAPPLLGDGLDFLMGTMKVKHTWIRTPYKEMGMALKPGTGIWTEWKDHTGTGDFEDSQCHFIADCDLRCVEDNLIEGKSLGIYGAFNTCHDAVVRVLSRCQCRNTCLDRKSVV